MYHLHFAKSTTLQMKKSALMAGALVENSWQGNKGSRSFVPFLLSPLAFFVGNKKNQFRITTP